MRTGAPAGLPGFFHEAAFYSSDEEFVAIVAPFLAGGVAAGEPVVAAFRPHLLALLRAAPGLAGNVHFLDGEEHYSRPATAIHRYRTLVAGHVAAGAGQVRVAGEIPHPGVGVPWDWWARYEAVINHAYDDLPLWGVCPYDIRSCAPEVIEQVRRTHPYIATTAGHRPNPDFADPEDFLRTRRTAWRDPLESTPPRAHLTDPMPAEMRAAVIAAAAHSAVPPPDLKGLVLAATEVVTNALVHGAPPVDARVWTAERRVLVTVADAGPGPRSRLAGIRPVRTPTGGLGLWIAHQSCAHVDLRHEEGRFTVRLLAGSPEP
ncbi:anti-sigma factor RsbA family regulatory protein [Dactylosporangium sp. NPDC051541]|uniref:anti-sigma factor RsbA family regulatory protein n=1 Tax=Dactylosporangium sp. NPDC051541 TaxID=3363977 RepID=UPI0037975120